jgi:hypothetical protein
MFLYALHGKIKKFVVRKYFQKKTNLLLLETDLIKHIDSLRVMEILEIKQNDPLP